MRNERDIVINVKVTAGARTESIEETAPYTLKLRVHTPPEKGRANERAIALLANYYKVPASRIILIHGSTSSLKRFMVRG